MWVDFVWGLLLGAFPAALARVFVGRYVMYLAKLGRSRLKVAAIGLALLTLLAFGFVCLSSYLVLLFKADFRPWLVKGGLMGLGTCVGVAWLHMCLQLVRYQASYFIEYTYPRRTIINGVPILITGLFAFSFWRSGLIEVGASILAQKTSNPAFCQAVKDKDGCEEHFYEGFEAKEEVVDPKICRALSGTHVLRCLVKHHPRHPETASCQAIRSREGEESAAYYWCLSYLPQSKEKKEACRRAENSSRWVNLYYGSCLSGQAFNAKIESGKTVLMQFLDVKHQSEQAEGLKKLGVKYPVSIRTPLASVITPKTELEATDREGRTVLFYVRSIEELEALATHNARLNHQDQNGMTVAMHWLSGPKAWNYQAHLQLAAKKGLEINAIDKKGRSALTHFLMSFRNQTELEKNQPENVSVVETLLRLGANPYIRDKAKRRAMDYAREYSLTDIQAALRNYREYRPQP